MLLKYSWPANASFLL